MQTILLGQIVNPDTGDVISRLSLTDTGLILEYFNTTGFFELNNVLVRGILAAPFIEEETVNLLTGNLGTFEAVSVTELLAGTGGADRDFEDSLTTGWTATGCTLASSATFAHSGTRSMSLSSTAGGTIKASTATGTSGMPVSPNTAYTFDRWIRTGATARLARGTIRWYKSDGSASAITPSTSSALTNDSTSFVERAWLAVSPPDAAFAAVEIEIQGTAAAELHYVDDVSFANRVPGWGPISAPRDTRLTVTAAQARTGTQSMLIEPGAGDEVFAIQGYPPQPCAAGRAVHGSLYARAVSGTPFANARLDFFDSSGATIVIVSGVSQALNASGWTQLTSLAVAPAGAATVAVGVEHATSAIYVDDVDLRQVATIHGGIASDGDLTVLGELISSMGIGFTTGPIIVPCTGTPEGQIVAPPGSLALRSDGGAATTLYAKESGMGNTGWVAK